MSKVFQVKPKRLKRSNGTVLTPDISYYKGARIGSDRNYPLFFRFKRAGGCVCETGILYRSRWCRHF